MNIEKYHIGKICEKHGYDLIDFEILGAGMGAFNLNYLLQTKQGKFVLRIEIVKTFRNKKQEFEILKMLKGRFGPKVYHFDDSGAIIDADYLIEEFIEFGDHPPPEASKEFIIATGEFYKKLHSIKVKISETKDYLQYYILPGFEEDLIIVRKHLHLLSDELKEITDLYYQEAAKIITENNDLFSNRTEMSLCQGDPTRRNIFYKKNEVTEKAEVKLVDWEMARYQIREWDLAFFVWAYDLQLEDKKLFLNIAGYPETDLSEKQFNIVYLLHCLGIQSWMIGRLQLVDEGKISSKLSSSSKEDLLDSIRENNTLIRAALVSLGWTL